jgi:hypothetical protein
MKMCRARVAPVEAPVPADLLLPVKCRVWSQDVLNSSVAGHGVQPKDILYDVEFGRGA